MRPGYDTHELDWEGIPLLIHWSPTFLNLEITGHMQIESVERQRLPITVTGYLSHFVHRTYVEAHGGPVAYALAWLSHEAKSSEWKRYVEDSRQGSLF